MTGQGLARGQQCDEETDSNNNVCVICGCLAGQCIKDFKVHVHERGFFNA